MSARSTNGCWTCRLRKKKCDETRPSCKRCSQLGINCHQYGNRPEWMDRGPLQKEAARRMKLYVSKRRAAPQDVGDEQQAKPVETSRPGSDSGYGTSPSMPTDIDYNTMFDDLDLGNITHQSLWEEDLINAPFSTGLSNTLDMALIPDPVLFSPLGVLPTSQTPLDPMLVDTLMGNCAFNNIPTLAPQSIEPMQWPSSSLPVQQDYFGAARPGAASRTSSSAQMLDALDHGPASGRIVDDELLMDYLDRIFYIYFPFYTSRQHQSRGWLLSVLKRDRASYHAALALTELHRLQDGVRSASQEGSHHWLALQELQNGLSLLSLDAASSATSIGLLTTILHLLLYELSQTGTCNWQMHLSAASTLLKPLAQNLPAILGAKVAKHEASTDPDATCFLLSFFACIDIIGSASTRTDPMLDISHKLVLEAAELDPINIFGCDSTVMICLLDTTSLDNWKQEVSRAHALSLVELADRGRRIEKRLRGLLANAEANISKGGTETAETTRIYTLAAIIYLHVVISGAYAEIPEIAESVSKSIDALQDLSEPKLLRSVVWPFCISGCLATSGQEHHFRKLASLPHMQEPQFGTCQAAFAIMKECWAGREAGGGHYDWAFSMAQRQRSILLA